jgi:hypothetical protein
MWRCALLLTACGRVDFELHDGPPHVVESLSVPADGTVITSTTTLAAGVRYQLRASGVMYISPYADAEYFFDLPDGPSTASQLHDLCDDNVTDCGLAVDDPVVNGLKQPRWGAYQPDHVYTIDFIGLGAPITSNVHDDYYPNNTGMLTLDILAY